MAMFAYSARDQEGRKVSGRMEASNQQAALSELESQGLAPMELSFASTFLSHAFRSDLSSPTRSRAALILSASSVDDFDSGAAFISLHFRGGKEET